MSTPATNPDQERNAPQPSLRGSFNAYASPQTLEQLGWLAEKTAEWAGRDVVFVSKDDLTAHRRTKIIENEDGSLSASSTSLGEQYAAHLTASMPENRQTELKTWLDSRGPETLNGFGSGAFLNEASALSMTKDFRFTPDSVCIITLPDLHDTKAAVAAQLGGENVDPNLLAGDDEDWLASVLTHEASHCRLHAPPPEVKEKFDVSKLREEFRNSHNHTLRQEIEADQQGFRLYAEAAAEGKPLDMKALHSFYEMRSIASMYHTETAALGGLGNTHATNVALQPDAHAHHDHSHDHAPAPIDAAQTESINRAQNEATMMAHMAIGMALGPGLVGEMEKENGKLALYPQGVDAALAKPDQQDITVSSQDFVTNPQRAALLSGYYIASEKPELLYAATKTLLERGAYEEGSLQHRFASDYVSAVENTAPSLIQPEYMTFMHDALEKTDGGMATITNAVKANLATPPAPDNTAPDSRISTLEKDPRKESHQSLAAPQM